MKLKLFGFAILTILLSACDTKTTLKFEISNELNIQIDSLRLIPSGYKSENYISIAPKETKEYVMDMTDIAKVDGDYQIDYKIDTNIYISKTFGYYTNGYPIEKLIKIKIKADTMLYESILSSY